MPASNQTRPLYDIAEEIANTWGDKVKYSALPYLRAMQSMDKVSDPYMYDSGDSVVRYFLANATGWRGEDAKRIKAELKAML